MARKTGASARRRQPSEDVSFWTGSGPAIRIVKDCLAVEVKTYPWLQGGTISLREHCVAAVHLALRIHLDKFAQLRSRLCCLDRAQEVPSSFTVARSKKHLEQWAYSRPFSKARNKMSRFY